MALFEVTKIFKDGTKTIEVVAGQVKIYPQRDNIQHSNCKRFRYDVKTKYTVAIAKTINGCFIVGGEGPWLPCHPDTQLGDINVIKEKIKVVKEIKEKEEIFTFNSKSSDSIYKVRIVMGKPKCDCAGQFRAKDRRCVHMKEVEKIIESRK
jgi:hypothetical protein